MLITSRSYRVELPFLFGMDTKALRFRSYQTLVKFFDWLIVWFIDYQQVNLTCFSSLCFSPIPRPKPSRQKLSTCVKKLNWWKISTSWWTNKGSKLFRYDVENWCWQYSLSTLSSFLAPLLLSITLNTLVCPPLPSPSVPPRISSLCFLLYKWMKRVCFWRNCHTASVGGYNRVS